MRIRIAVLSTLLCFIPPAMAQLSINFGSPGVSIGINLGSYPTLQRVPGYPVYYAPGVNSNYFFYDGLYWVYQGDNWYESSWYNGPWYAVNPMDVPEFVLRVPVRYYRHAPAYFRSWRADDAPRWGEHWGQSWEKRRSGWDQWNHSSAPAPAPLPTYQRQYTGNKYPQASQQAVLQTQNYRYQPSNDVARQHYQQQRTQAQAAPQQQQPQQQPQRQQAQQQQQQQQQPQRQQQQHQQAQPVQQQQQAQPVQPAQNPAARPAPRPQPPQPQQQQQQQQQAQRGQPQAQQQQQHQQPAQQENKGHQENKGKGNEKQDDKEKNKDR